MNQQKKFLNLTEQSIQYMWNIGCLMRCQFCSAGKTSSENAINLGLSWTFFIGNWLTDLRHSTVSADTALTRLFTNVANNASSPAPNKENNLTLIYWVVLFIG